MSIPRQAVNELSTTPHGRLLSTAICLTLLGGGLSATIHDPMGIALMCVAIVVGIALSLVATAMAIETRPAFAIFSIINLPFAMFAFVVGLGVVQHGAHWGAYAFMLLGAAFGVLALMGKRSDVHHPHDSTLANAH
jgi:hypothetical protein